MHTRMTVIGTVASDPKLITPASGPTLCSFRLASDERHYDSAKRSWVEGETNWFGVVCFRALAANAYASFRKGERIVVTGKLRVRRWSKDDRQGTSVEIEAEGIGHDVRFGIARFEKRTGGANATNANAAGTATAQDEGFAEPEEPRDAEPPVDATQFPQGTPDATLLTGADAMEGDGFLPAMAA